MLSRLLKPIFYTGDKFTKLKDSFIFVSFNDGNLHSIRINEKNNQTYLEELVIDFNHDFPDNIVSIAQSPSGDLYYGGYNIYKVESISPQSEQRVYSISANLTNGVNVKDMQLLIPENSLLLHVNYNRNSSGKTYGGMNLKIPFNLLSDIYSVSTNDSSKVEKNQENSMVSSNFLAKSENGTTVQFTLDKTGDKIIFMNGTGTELSADYY